MKTILIIFIILFLIACFLFAKNYWNATRIDRRLNRREKEAERAEIDRLYEMKQRNIQLQKFRK